jgi:hypothetical protein
MARPKKIVWPIGFEELLCFAFKQKRPEHRIKFYRLFLRDHLHKGTIIQASPEEIETALIADRQKTFDENWAYHIRMWSTMSFQKWKQESLQNTGRIRALKRWPKENIEK